jgi:hypothetical protein
MTLATQTRIATAALAAALVATSACVTRVNAPSVRPLAITAPEGDWDEILINQSVTTILTRYRADSLRVEDVRRIRSRRADKARDFLRRRVERRDTVDVAYTIAGPGGFRAGVQGTYVQYSDIERSSAVWRIGSAPDDEDTDDRSYYRLAYASDLRVRLGEDSTDWRLTTTWTWDSSGTQELRRILTRSGREFTMTAIGPFGRSIEPGRVQFTLIPEAAGWLVLDDQTPVAAVQTQGGGLWGTNDLRAWVPRGLDTAERRARVAMLLMLLEGSSRTAFTRQH